MHIEWVDRAYLDEAWPSVAYWLERGSAGADYDIGHLRSFVARGQAVLLLARNDIGCPIGAAVAEVQMPPKARVFHVMAMGGKGVCVPEIVESLKTAARDWFGCDVIQCWAKDAPKGNARLYRQLGFRDVSVVMRMECDK